MWPSLPLSRPAAVAASCVLVGLLLALGWHAVHVLGGRDQGWSACVRDPVANAGMAVVLPLHDVGVSENSPSMVSLSQSWRNIPVLPPPDVSRPAPGTVVSIVGTCAGPPAHVVATMMKPHPLRPWKEGIGIGVLALWLLSLPLCLRRTPDGWVARG